MQPTQYYQKLTDFVQFAPPPAGSAFSNLPWDLHLAQLAEPENWDYETQGDTGVIRHYLRHYVQAAIEEDLLVQRRQADGRAIAAFNTGLLSRELHSPLYGILVENMNAGQQPWVLREWVTCNSRRLLANFDPDELRKPTFFSSLSQVIFDPTVRVSVNLEHMMENLDRFPDFVVNEPTWIARALIKSAIEQSLEHVRGNWRAAAAQVFQRDSAIAWPKPHRAVSPSAELQFLMPLWFESPDKVDLALVVEKTAAGTYLASTVLHLRWAYSNARVLGRPESSWLIPGQVSATKSAEKRHQSHLRAPLIETLNPETRTRLNQLAS